jgi:hypothetical protein
MSRTAMPASRRAFEVPPVETSSTPRSARVWAKSTRPDLSVTESRARRTGLNPLIEVILTGGAVGIWTGGAGEDF